ncbi:MAG: D-aminoacyl-tRNA deacylase [Candidatus Hodarchaeota archaeon]
MILFLASTNDLAANNIQTYLQETYDFRESTINCGVGSLTEYQGIFLLRVNEEIVTADLKQVETELEPELIIALSRHRAESKMPALLAHPQGNWTKQVALGGQAETISMTSGTALKLAINALKEQKNELKLENYLCGLEVTHHGPITAAPMIFIEIGSSKDEWAKSEPAEAVGEAAIQVARNWSQSFPTVVGIGGTHYAPRFNELIGRTAFAVSHVMPKYVLDSANLPRMLEQAILKTSEQVEICAYDHGGTKSLQRTQAREVAESLGLEFVRVRDLLRNHDQNI